MTAVAIVGMACRYPDADSTAELWENALAGRRAFRALPPERMGEDYFSADTTQPDRHYATKAAVLEGWEFDRARFRVSGNTFRSTDLTHWLALETADAALRDAGFVDGKDLERADTTVILGNTLTGEFTRAGLMRLRWPYVKRTLASALDEQGWTPEAIATFLAAYETKYKSAFPDVTEDSLAGGLANTIAGRICNHFDFGGGGFTVDAACSSSLVAVINGAEAVATGKARAAVVGGVDLSIDPFEVIGFAKTGALSTSEMRVYDQGSNGFWPGEGCGMLVLMPQEEAVAQGRRIYATLAGWGYSSDGHGGMTRPEASGHLRAIDRAYAMAGFDFGDLGYVEGHGTGTPLGDRTELGVFEDARSRTSETPVPIGTVKGNIGHTKAAAGAAGLIKATLAVYHGVVPPITGNTVEHEQFGEGGHLRLPREPERWSASVRRAGVSSMGFGGINTHVTVQHEGPPARGLSTRQVSRLARSAQDAELLVVSEDTREGLRERLASLAVTVGRCSYAELGDVAVELARTDRGRRYRAAVVEGDPAVAATSLTALVDALDEGVQTVFEPARGRFLGVAESAPRIGLLFPGQGAPGRGDGGAVARRFESVAELYRRADPPRDSVATEDAQPRIVTASVAGLTLLDQLDLEAVGCVGHSLGELTSLHWGGAFDFERLLAAATARGRIMAHASTDGGAMASIGADGEVVSTLLSGTAAVVAGYNGPTQTVVSGQAAAVEEVVRRASARGLTATPLQVSHAFHSPDVAPAAGAFREYLDDSGDVCVTRDGVFSTVTGGELRTDSSANGLLETQICEPVRFEQALRGLAESADLLIEVGPGRALSTLATTITPETPAVAMETDGPSLRGVLSVVGASFALGAEPDLHHLVADRFTRPFDLDRSPTFLESPCEHHPVVDLPEVESVPGSSTSPVMVETAADAGDTSALEILRSVVATGVELPVEQVQAHTRPLDELHLSSITVTQYAGEAARRLGVPMPPLGTNLATASLADIAEVLESARQNQPAEEATGEIAGVAPWVRTFEVQWVEEPAASGVPITAARESDWTFWGTATDLSDRLLQLLRTTTGHPGVLLRLGADDAGVEVGTMLSAARAAVAGAGRLVVLDQDASAAGVARSLALEHPEIPTTLLTLAPGLDDLELAPLLLRDVTGTESYCEVGYDSEGIRSRPRLSVLDLDDEGDLGLGTDDVLLVTGGARGITVEAALAIGEATGCQLALMGRTAPEDPQIRAAVDRLRGRGVRVTYHQADVTSAEDVEQAIASVRGTAGPVTAVLHGAGVNRPAALETLEETEFERTLATKVDGLRNILQAVDQGALRAVVAFGSIIGRAGLSGEAHYATANDRMRRMVEELQMQLPECRCLAIEWSVWAGAGMGEDLGVLDSLLRDGIQPIPLDEGIRTLLALLRSQTPTTVVVMGRAASLGTLEFVRTELPLLRFLERTVTHVPGVELVVEAALSARQDPYLLDHDLDGSLLFPAVLGMEAMAQVHRALVGRNDVQFSDLVFEQPILVPADTGATLRIAALREGDHVRVVLRSSETGFHTDHFTAVTRSRPRDGESSLGLVDVPGPSASTTLSAHRLYGTLMFQGDRFQAVDTYTRLSATSTVARLAVVDRKDWFAGHLPAELLLLSPSTRDAFMHALQVCVPDATLLPGAIASIESLPVPDHVEQLWLLATEQRREGDVYWYDLDAAGPDGEVYVRWRGLQLHAVRHADGSGPWLPELFGPYVERRLGDGHSVDVRVAIGEDATSSLADRRAHTAQLLGELHGSDLALTYRDDGRPEASSRSMSVSASHSGALTLAVLSETDSVGCDLERVVSREDESWEDLLGREGLGLATACAHQQAEPLAVSATRVWSAREALAKLSGEAEPARLSLSPAPDQRGWVRFSRGSEVVTTVATAFAGESDGSVIAIARRQG